MNVATLREQLVQSFDLGEFKTLCVDLSVNYDVLPGDGLENKARELIALCHRQGRMPALINECRRVRPLITWQEPDDLSSLDALEPEPPRRRSRARVWLGRHRRKIALGAAIIVGGGLILNVAQVWPFHRRLVWTALGLEAPNAMHLARADAQALVAGGAHIAPTCDDPDPGLWTSADNGRTWRGENLPDLCYQQGTASARADIEAFAVSPALPQRTYVATSHAGMLRQDAPGAPWAFTGADGLPNRRLFTIAADPANANRVYASKLESIDEGTGLFVSDDAGATWRQLDERRASSPCTTGTPWSGAVNVGALLTAPGRVFVGTGDPNLIKAVNKGLYVSEDGGQCWRQIDDGGTGNSQFRYRALTHARTKSGEYLLMAVEDVWARTFALYRLDLNAASARRERINVEVESVKALAVQGGRWFLAEGGPRGRVLTGSIDDASTSAELPATTALCILDCDVSLAADTESDVPLMLVRSYADARGIARIYRLSQGPWWKRLFPS